MGNNSETLQISAAPKQPVDTGFLDGLVQMLKNHRLLRFLLSGAAGVGAGIVVAPAVLAEEPSQPQPRPGVSIEGSLKINVGCCEKPECEKQPPAPPATSAPTDKSAAATAGSGRPATRKAAAAPAKGVRLMKAYDPRTFFVDTLDAAERLGSDGQPRGFEVGMDRPFTFFITGPFETRFKIFVWLPVTEKVRGKPEALKTEVTIDGVRYETTPQPIGQGKIMPGTEYPPDEKDRDKQLGLWTAFVVTPPYKIGPGTHAVAFKPSNHGVRVTLIGPDEVTLTRPDTSEPAIQVPFEEDPRMPAEFEFPGRVRASSLSPSGYVVEGTDGSPLAINETPGRGDGLDLTVCPLSESPDVMLVLSRGVRGDLAETLCKLKGTGEEPAPNKVVYRLKGGLPADPNVPVELAFERTVPPSHSDAYGVPGEIYLDLDVNAGNPNEVAVEVARQPKEIRRVRCQVNNVRDADPPRANVYCWGQNARGQTEAYEGSADTRSMTEPVRTRRHLLKKIP